MLLRYAIDRGWEVYRIYCDEDYSGADALRPDFNRMLEAARAGKFQIILCKNQSRFTRDMELVEKYLHGLFPLWGIRFIAVTDNADTGIRGNKKARQINGLINEWYLEDLSDNIRAVLDMKRRQGQYIGSSPVYGYFRDPADKHRLLIDPAAAEVVRQIFRWALEGHGRQEIAHMLNDRGVLSPTRYKAGQSLNVRAAGEGLCGLWNKTAVWRILRNEIYAGVMVQGRTKKVSYKSRARVGVPQNRWFRVEGTHEAIVDRSAFDAVQRSLSLRSRSDGTGEVHPLSGLVRCMDCGCAMTKTSRSCKGKRLSYLRCRLYAESGRDKLCTRHGIRLDALLDLVTERVGYYVRNHFDPERLALSLPRDVRRNALERERKALAAQLEKRGLALKSLYLDRAVGIVSEGQFAELNRAFLTEKRQLERQLTQTEDELARLEPPRDRDALLARARELLELETLPRELAALLIEKVEIGEKDPAAGVQEIRIIWKF